MEKVRFGILGTAKIAREKVIPALQKAQCIEVTAIASRSKAAADKTAELLGIPKAHASYEKLLKDSKVDAVYIPLPNHLHVDWTIRAMAAGKHVLCEKPLGMCDDEVNRLIDATSRYPDIKVMEAFMYRHHPQWEEIKRLVDAKEIGELVSIHTEFSYFNADPANIRNNAESGGGALMDIGCYAIALSRFLLDAEPRRVFGLLDMDPAFGTDKTATAMLDFSGRISTFSCSTQGARHQHVSIVGTTGRIDIPLPFNPLPDSPAQFLLQRDHIDDPAHALKTVTFPICDQYTTMADRFAKSILDDTPAPVGLTDAWANMHVIDAIRESSATGQWEAC
ncbi:Gfo/Idh/MocA family protein [Pseudodesulfovibrio sp.]|uniref:Gfo/Idh/MocA family protein n=1 Tax=unclassified Pseudodesulfovibrio TaxID=2661612 RepID=UPI003B00566E